jgi:single-stranded-DNA-specific exonuclease
VVPEPDDLGAREKRRQGVPASPGEPSRAPIGGGWTVEPARLPGARAWLDRHGAGAALVPHHDADGLSAAVLLARRATGRVIHVDSPWTDPLPGGAAVIADWGVRALSGGPEPVLYVDHHADPEPVAGEVVHAVGDGVTTSVLAWDLLDRPADGAWLAALGANGDLATPALARPELAGAGTKSDLQRLASLVTAPGRLRGGPVADAYRLLVESTDARAALSHPLRASLEEARSEVGAARERAVRTAPQVGVHAALIRFSDRARVHPLVASAWARRLAPRVVVAANEGWREGLVSFAVRSADEIDLRAWLRERHEPAAGAGDYARGHARATGGALAPQAFEEFAAAVLA